MAGIPRQRGLNAGRIRARNRGQLKKIRGFRRDGGLWTGRQSRFHGRTRFRYPAQTVSRPTQTDQINGILLSPLGRFSQQVVGPRMVASLINQPPQLAGHRAVGTGQLPRLPRKFNRSSRVLQRTSIQIGQAQRGRQQSRIAFQSRGIRRRRLREFFLLFQCFRQPLLQQRVIRTSPGQRRKLNACLRQGRFP